MSEKSKYPIDGKYLTQAEYLDYVHKHAETITDPIERQSYINTFNQLFNHDLATEKEVQKHEMRMENRKDIVQHLVLPIVGILGLIAMVWLAIKNPSPTVFQSGIYWVALCLLAGILVGLMTGFVRFKQSQLGIQAGGGMAFALIMYFFLPAIMSSKSIDSTNKMNIYVAKSDTSQIEKIDVDFDQNSGITVCDFAQKNIDKYYGSQDTFTCYRRSDGMIYSKEECRSVREYEMLMISNRLMIFYNNKRDAYTHFLTLVK